MSEPITYTHNAGDGLVLVPWPDINRICRIRLGHDYQPGRESDRAVREALVAAGAPNWVRDAEAVTDDYGWTAYRPADREHSVPLPGGYASVSDALDAVRGSGVADWDWGDRDAEETLIDLAAYLWRNNRTLDDEALQGFIRNVLGDDPADYGPGQT